MFVKLKVNLLLDLIYLILIGCLVGQLGNLMNFFNDTFDYSETIYVVDERINFIQNLNKILIISFLM